MSDFANHCVELLSTLGQARAKRMFGGHGLYVDELFIALVLDDTLYLKADEQTRAAFEQAGCHPFVYDAKDNKRVTVSYWSAPDAALESPDILRPWARLAMEAALRARAAKLSKPARAGRRTPAPATPKRASPRRR